MNTSVTTCGLLMGVLAGLALGPASLSPAWGATPDELEAAMERDLTVAQKPIYNFGQQPIAGRMEVDAWVDNPNLTYAVGQPFRVIVRPKRDAYITIVDVGSSGRVSVLFPNHFQRESRVHGNQTVMIPTDRSQWEVKVSGPPGVDLIQVIASQNPLTLPELNGLVRATEASPMVTLGRSAEEVTRDLTAQLKPQFGGPGGPAPQSYGVRNLMIRIVNPSVSPVLLPPAPVAEYGLSIRTDRAAYRVGQPIRIMVSSRSDCRLTLVSVGPSGRVSQLFPNPGQRDNLLLAGQVVVIPSANSPLQIVAQRPAGVEGLIGTCRGGGAPAAAFDPSATGFVNLGTVETYGRDLMANTAPDQGQDNGQRQADTEESSSSYLVIE